MLKKTVLVMLTALLIFVVPVSAQEEVMELDEVVVTASRYQERIMDTPVSIEVIDQEEIEDSAANNLAEILQFAGGVHIKDNGGLAGKKDILIRGLRSRQILILLDGQPYNSAQSGEVRLESMPVEIIKRIEVLKSPSSAIYGANAMGGVINIITKESEDIKKTNLNLASGSFNTKKVNLSHSYQGNKSSLLFVYDYLDSEGHRDNSNFDRNDLYAKYNYSINNNNQLTVSYRYNDTKTEYPGSLNTDSDGILENSENNINLILKQNYDNQDRKISVFNNNRNLDDLSWDTETEINKRGISLQQNDYFNSHLLSYGVDIEENEVDYNDSANEYKESNLNYGIYLQDKYQLNKKNTFNIGVRYDEHEEYGSELSPSIGYIYKINDNLNFNANAADSFRAPNYLELYYPGSGNSDLEPEKARSYDLGFKYNSSLGRGTLSFFRREIEDLIVYVPTGMYSGINKNINSAVTKGLEISLGREVLKNLNIDFNYTYLDAADEAGNQLIDMPYNELSLKLKYEIYDSRIILNNRYVGERESVNEIYGEANVSMPSYFISDLKIENELTENTQLSVEVNNLFDKEYQVVDGYPMPDRNFMINLSTKF